MTVESTLELLVDRLFDHSGTFPPASRSLEDALKDAAAFKTDLKRPWMVGTDLVLELKNLQALHTVDLRVFGFAEGRTVSLAVLWAAGSEAELRQDLRWAGLSRRPDAVRLQVSSIECKVSSELSADLNKFSGFLSKVRVAIGESSSTLLAIEPDLSGSDWKEALANTILALKAAPNMPPVALKCRCTGPTAVDGEKLAAAIATVCDSKLPFKVTGGLHHPIVERERYKNDLGFLNLAVAVMARRVLGERVTEKILINTLTNDRSDYFDFNGALKFGDLTIEYAELQQAKQLAHFSIGSCSLSEPDDDLNRLYGAPKE